MNVNPRHRALLQRIADGQRSFSHPSQELVDDLHSMEGHGWLRNVKTLEAHQQAGGGWDVAAALITYEGKEVFKGE